MITRKQGFQHQYDANGWVGRSGKASWYPDRIQFKQQGGQPPAGALQSGGAQMLIMRKPKLMADPSDPTTWQREYRFT